MSKSRITVPYGWKRDLDPINSVIKYTTPTGIILSSIVEVCQYLEKEDTCKCGLICPIHVPKIFSFNPKVSSVNLSRERWKHSRSERDGHKTHCQHWIRLQKRQLGKKKSSRLIAEPPPKLLIIRKDGKLRSVIPDEKGNHLKREIDEEKVIKPSTKISTSSASSSTTTSPLKSPLFEPTAPGVVGKSKLQWIKADGETSHDDIESGSELCFSPDLNKSNSLSLSHSFLHNSTKINLQQNICNRDIGSPAMGQFPGAFTRPNNTKFGYHTPSVVEISNKMTMKVKHERDSQPNQTHLFGPGMPANNGQQNSLIPGMSGWQHNTLNQSSVNQRQCRPRENIPMPVRGALQGNIHNIKSYSHQILPQRPPMHPMGSPPMVNPTSPYNFQMNASAMPMGSPVGTNPSPFSNRSQSRSSSVGTPGPSPCGPWQGPRLNQSVGESSRPLSRSSSSATPVMDSSPIGMNQWNSATGPNANYPARNPGNAHGFTPILSPGPLSPFSPSRFTSNTGNISGFNEDIQGQPIEPTVHSVRPNFAASQQLRMHSQSLQQQQHCQRIELTPRLRQFRPSSNINTSSFSVPMYANHRQIAQTSKPSENTSPSANPALYRPCPPYNAQRITFARINEPELNSQQKFPFAMNQPRIPGMHQNLIHPLPQHQWRFNQTITPSHRAQYYQNPMYPDHSVQAQRPRPPKPKRTKKKKIKVTAPKSNPQPAPITSTIKNEFSDIFDQSEIIGLSNEVSMECAELPVIKPSHNSENTSSTSPNLIMPSKMDISSTVAVSTSSPSDQIHGATSNSSSINPSSETSSKAPSVSSIDRDVTTPPLPVLSPTYLYDRSESPMDEEFPDFVDSTTVFDLPKDTSPMLNSMSEKVSLSANMISSTKPLSWVTTSVTSISCFPTSTIVSQMVEVKTVSVTDNSEKLTDCGMQSSENSARKLLPLPITKTVQLIVSTGGGKMSTCISPPVIGKLPTLPHSSMLVATVEKTSLSAFITSSSFKTFTSIVPPRQDVTSLVSSLGGLFHLPQSSEKNKVMGRIGDHISQETGSSSNTRKRYPSEPYSTPLSLPMTPMKKRPASCVSTLTAEKEQAVNAACLNQVSSSSSLSTASSESSTSTVTVQIPSLHKPVTCCQDYSNLLSESSSIAATSKYVCPSSNEQYSQVVSSAVISSKSESGKLDVTDTTNALIAVDKSSTEILNPENCQSNFPESCDAMDTEKEGLDNSAPFQMKNNKLPIESEKISINLHKSDDKINQIKDSSSTDSIISTIVQSQNTPSPEQKQHIDLCKTQDNNLKEKSTLKQSSTTEIVNNFSADCLKCDSDDESPHSPNHSSIDNLKNSDDSGERTLSCDSHVSSNIKTIDCNVMTKDTDTVCDVEVHQRSPSICSIASNSSKLCTVESQPMKHEEEVEEVKSCHLGVDPVTSNISIQIHLKKIDELQKVEISPKKCGNVEDLRISHCHGESDPLKVCQDGITTDRSTEASQTEIVGIESESTTPSINEDILKKSERSSEQDSKSLDSAQQGDSQDEIERPSISLVASEPCDKDSDNPVSAQVDHIKIPESIQDGRTDNSITAAPVQENNINLEVIFQDLEESTDTSDAVPMHESNSELSLQQNLDEKSFTKPETSLKIEAKTLTEREQSDAEDAKKFVSQANEAVEPLPDHGQSNLSSLKTSIQSNDSSQGFSEDLETHERDSGSFQNSQNKISSNSGSEDELSNNRRTETIASGSKNKSDTEQASDVTSNLPADDQPENVKSADKISSSEDNNNINVTHPSNDAMSKTICSQINLESQNSTQVDGTVISDDVMTEDCDDTPRNSEISTSKAFISELKSEDNKMNRMCKTDILYTDSTKNSALSPSNLSKVSDEAVSALSSTASTEKSDINILDFPMKENPNSQKSSPNDESEKASQCNPSSVSSDGPSLSISPELTTTVIRQLSNYNTILKNLLVQQVGPGADIVQLASTSRPEGVKQSEVISAFISKSVNHVDPARLFEQAATVMQGSSVPLISDITSNTGKQEPSVLNIDIDKQEDNLASSISLKASSQDSKSTKTDSIMNNLIPPDSSQMFQGDDDQSSSKGSQESECTHQGLQVPIVSSSVKGSQEDVEGPDVSDDSKDSQHQSEVSTSMKVTPTLKTSQSVVKTVEVVTERRRGRSRNAAIKQVNKRPAVTDVNTERPTKRQASSASSSSSSQRGSHKQSRIFKNGDLVWGQMRGFPSWPGKVVKPSEVRGVQQRAPLSDGKVWVRWFGDHTFTQMNPLDLVTMTEGLEAHHKSRRKGRTRTKKISVHLETAIQEAVDELEQQQAALGKKSHLSLQSSPTVVIPLTPMISEQLEKPRRGRKRKGT